MRSRECFVCSFSPNDLFIFAFSEINFLSLLPKGLSRRREMIPDRDKEPKEFQNWFRSEPRGNGKTRIETRNQSIPIHYEFQALYSSNRAASSSRSRLPQPRAQLETSVIILIREEERKRDGKKTFLGRACSFVDLLPLINQISRGLLWFMVGCFFFPVFRFLGKGKGTHEHQRTDSQPVIMIPRNPREAKQSIRFTALKINWRSREALEVFFLFFFISRSRRAFFRVIELIKKFLNLQRGHQHHRQGTSHR